jgi:hypothetical protein
MVVLVTHGLGQEPARGARGFADRISNAVTAANTLSEDDLAARDLETLLIEIVDTYGAHPIVVHFDRKYVNSREIHGPNDKAILKPLQIDIRVPAEGEVATLFDVPERALSSTHSSGEEHEVILTLNSPDGLGAEDMAKVIQGWGEALETSLRSANALIAEHRVAILDAVRPILESRWRRTRLLRGALRDLSIPLQRVDSPLASIPLRPAALSMAKLESAAADGVPEWSLANDMAEGVISTISGFSMALERLPQTANRLVGEHEETLRDVLLFILNAQYHGLATGETFIGKGKSDLLLRWKNRDAFVGECKIWNGPAALTDGVEQLLTRYTLWRQSRIALILFIRDPADGSRIIETAHQTIADNTRTQSVYNFSEPDRRRDYTVATSDDRRPATLTLLPVVIQRT